VPLGVTFFHPEQVHGGVTATYWGRGRFEAAHSPAVSAATSSAVDAAWLPAAGRYGLITLGAKTCSTSSSRVRHQSFQFDDPAEAMVSERRLALP
jgi:hypothetical protein